VDGFVKRRTVQIGFLVNLDVSEPVAGEFLDDIIVGAIGPADEDDGQGESSHNAQSGEDGPAPVAEDVTEGHFKGEHA
jgi:hypothetical protein